MSLRSFDELFEKTKVRLETLQALTPVRRLAMVCKGNHPRKAGIEASKI